MQFSLEGVTCHGCFSQLVWINFAASLDCLRIDDVLRPFSNVKRKVVIDFQEESILKSLYQIHDFATGCTFGFATKPSGPGNRSWSRAWSHMLGAYEEQRKRKVKIQNMHITSVGMQDYFGNTNRYGHSAYMTVFVQSLDMNKEGHWRHVYRCGRLSVDHELQKCRSVCCRRNSKEDSWEFLSLHWSVLLGLCVVLPRRLLTAVRYGSLTVFRFNYSTAKEAWRDQGTYASISRNFPFRPHWNVSLLLCQVWCPRMTLLLWLLPRRSEPTEKRCWCQKRNCCNFRPLHFLLTGWVAEELSSLCGAFPRTQSSWDPDLLGGHVVLSDCNCENKTQAKATDIWDCRTRATKRTLSVPPHQICRLHACLPQHLAPIKDGYLLLLLHFFSLFQRLRKACTW